MYFYTCNNRNKKTSEKIFICGYTVPSLFSFIFITCRAIFPVQIHGSQLFSWLHFFQTDTGLNSGTDTLSELTSNTQNILLNQVNDFSVSISSQFSGGLNTILFLIWITGVMIMSVLTLHSLNYVRSIKRSALPLQNQQVKTIYYNCLKELKNLSPSISLQYCIFKITSFNRNNTSQNLHSHPFNFRTES